MTEDEVNLKVKEWLLHHFFKYKGICKTRLELTKQQQNPLHHTTQEGKLIDNNQARHRISQNRGFGQVPVPDGTRSVLIDHQGFRDDIPDLIWVEAKGSDVGLSQLLEGFIRVGYGVFHGGGKGYLAIPRNEYEKLLEQKDFLKAVAESINGKGTMGLLDVEKGELIEF